MIPTIPIPGFHDPFSSLSHLIGAGICAVLAVPLLRRGWGDPLRVAALAVYAFSCVFLLSMSGVYHLLPKGETARDEVLARLDHGAIFVLIAGTFTPIHVIAFHGRGRWLPLVVLWSMAATAIPLKMVYFEEFPESLGLAIYLGMGWLGAGTGAVLWLRYGAAFMRPMVWGGIAYTVGAVLEFLKWPEVIPGVIGPHELFHVAVLFGVGFFWWFVWRIAPGVTPALAKQEVKEHADRLADLSGELPAPEAAPGTLSTAGPAPDPDLARILAAWPDLPTRYKKALVALVEEAGSQAN